MDIRKRRKELKLTQIELAKRVGVSMMTVQLWERNVTRPSEENYQKLLEALEIIPFAE